LEAINDSVQIRNLARIGDFHNQGHSRSLPNVLRNAVSSVPNTLERSGVGSELENTASEDSCAVFANKMSNVQKVLLRFNGAWAGDNDKTSIANYNVSNLDRCGCMFHLSSQSHPWIGLKILKLQEFVQ
jgi:hypothetical protein